MEQPQTSKLLTLESNLDQLAHELYQLASRATQPEQHPLRDDSPSGQGQYLVATGRS